jgi:Dolichyl-phosphate-mannose-protein mannosyltransferase
MKLPSKLLFIAILLTALAVRTYGINWDSNQHVNPDERFLSMVAATIRVPESFSDYLDPQISPLNPFNYSGFGFFVYGTWPLTLTKISAAYFGMDSYDGVTIIGRLLSAISDVGTLMFVYFIALLLEEKLRISHRVKYYAAGIYACMVLPIQYSHFFTMDSMAVFFSVGSVYFAVKYYFEEGLHNTLMAGAFIGMALGSKVSSVFIMPLIAILCVAGSMKKPSRLRHLFINGLVGVISAYLFLRISDPRFFESGSFFDLRMNDMFLKNIAELRGLTSSTSTFPPNLQWLSKTPIWFPLKNLVLYGMGLPMALIASFGIIHTTAKKQPPFVMITLWIILFFLYQSTRTVFTMRYFYILYPFLALYTGLGLAAIHSNLQERRKRWIMAPLIACLLIWPISFLHIYSQPHPYIRASQWIYRTIPRGSKIALEHWNDALPLNMPSSTTHKPHLIRDYATTELPVFFPDSARKDIEIQGILAKTDYYIIPNNRAYGSIGDLPEMFPTTSKRYAALLAGQTEFKQVAEFHSYPTLDLGFWKLEMPDQMAEEAFSVYDHPRVLIFKRLPLIKR